MQRELVCALTLVLLLASPATLAHDTPTVLEGVKPRAAADGDTYVVHFRSEGIDSPETKQLCERADGSCYRCGESATQALQDIIAYKDEQGRTQYHGLQVRFWTVGKYGRPVVTVYRDGKDVHETMIRAGWAIAYRKYLPEPLRDA